MLSQHKDYTECFLEEIDKQKQIQKYKAAMEASVHSTHNLLCHFSIDPAIKSCSQTSRLMSLRSSLEEAHWQVTAANMAGVQLLVYIIIIGQA